MLLYSTTKPERLIDNKSRTNGNLAYRKIKPMYCFPKLEESSFKAQSSFQFRTWITKASTINLNHFMQGYGERKVFHTFAESLEYQIWCPSRMRQLPMPPTYHSIPQGWGQKEKILVVKMSTFHAKDLGPLCKKHLIPIPDWLPTKLLQRKQRHSKRLRKKQSKKRQVGIMKVFISCSRIADSSFQNEETHLRK